MQGPFSCPACWRQDDSWTISLFTKGFQHMLKSMSQVMKRTWAQLFNYFPLYFLFKYHLVSKQNEISQVLVDIQS